MTRFVSLGTDTPASRATAGIDSSPTRRARITVPDAGELAARLARRRELNRTTPPVELGEHSPMPPDDYFPPAVARMTRAMMTYMGLADDLPADTGVETGAATVLRGAGASAGVHEGRARLVDGPEAFAAIEPGDVLVARDTSPAHNVLLPLIGAIVTDRGGLLSHAAIVARECGLPAVVGTGEATTTIADGSLVRVDGDRGTVTLLASVTAKG